MRKIFLLLFIFLAQTASAEMTVPSASIPDNSLRMEEVQEWTLPFTGKLINHGPAILLDDNDFRELENFRYYLNGIVTRKGMTDYTGDDNSGADPVKIIPFDAKVDDTLYLLVASGTGWDYTEIQSGVTYAVSATHSTSGTGKITYSVCRDSLVVADGSDLWTWPGDNTYPEALLIEYSADVFSDRHSWIYDATAHSVASGATPYVGYTRPFDDCVAYTGGGATGVASGTTPAFKGGKWLYWSTIASGTTIQSPLVTFTDGTTLTGDLWSGEEWMYAQECIFIQSAAVDDERDFGFQVRNSSTELYADVSEFDATGGFLYASFPERPWKIKIFFPENNKNESASILSANYWDGDSWAALSDFVDGTADDGATFAQTGVLEYTMPSDWQKRTYGQGTFEGYPIQLTVGTDLDNYVRIYKIVAIPKPDDVNDENWTMTGGYRNRVILANGVDKSVIRISEENQPDTFTGYDACYAQAGEKNENFMGLVELDQGLLIMKENGNYFMTGVNPSTFTVEPLKGTTPCVSQESIVKVQTSNGLYVFYAGADGIYMISPDGQNVKISEDIKAYWEVANDLLITSGWADDTIGWYDKNYKEIHFLVAVGSSATAFTHELVYNLEFNKWSVFERASGKTLRTAIGYKNSNEEWVCLGGGYDGVIYTLESGSDDDGTHITSIIERKPLILNSLVGRQELYSTAFYYSLPDSDPMLGGRLSVTAGIGGNDSADTTNEIFTDQGFLYTELDSSDPRTGQYHMFDLTFDGRIELMKQVIWTKPASLPLKNLRDQWGDSDFFGNNDPWGE